MKLSYMGADGIRMKVSGLEDSFEEVVVKKYMPHIIYRTNNVKVSHSHTTAATYLKVLLLNEICIQPKPLNLEISIIYDECRNDMT